MEDELVPALRRLAQELVEVHLAPAFEQPRLKLGQSGLHAEGGLRQKEGFRPIARLPVLGFITILALARLPVFLGASGVLVLGVHVRKPVRRRGAVVLKFRATDRAKWPFQ